MRWLALLWAADKDFFYSVLHCVALINYLITEITVIHWWIKQCSSVSVCQEFRYLLVSGNGKTQCTIVVCLLQYRSWKARWSFKKATNVTYLVTLSSEICAHRGMNSIGRVYTWIWIKKSMEMWLCSAQPCGNSPVRSEQNQLSVVKITNPLGFFI